MKKYQVEICCEGCMSFLLETFNTRKEAEMRYIDLKKQYKGKKCVEEDNILLDKLTFDTIEDFEDGMYDIENLKIENLK